MAKDKKAKDQKVKSIKKQQKRRSKIAIKQPSLTISRKTLPQAKPHSKNCLSKPSPKNPQPLQPINPQPTFTNPIRTQTLSSSRLIYPSFVLQVKKEPVPCQENVSNNKFSSNFDNKKKIIKKDKSPKTDKLSLRQKERELQEIEDASKIQDLENMVQKLYFYVGNVFIFKSMCWPINEDTLSQGHSIQILTMQHLMNLFLYMAQSSVKQIILSSTIQQPKSKLYQSITQISFTLLQNLHINHRGIYSLQPLQWLDCPLLKFLTIEQTPITSAQPLNKLKLNNLSYLRIVKTHIPLFTLQRIKIKKGSNLSVIYSLHPYEYRSYNYLQQMIAIQDISLLAKSEIQWQTFTRNVKFAKNRIYQFKVLRKMELMKMISWGDDDQDDDY